MQIFMSQGIQKTGTNQKACGKNSAEKDQDEAPKRVRQKSLLLCPFERVESFKQVLSHGLDAVQPLSLTSDPDSQCCLRLRDSSASASASASSSSGIREQSNLTCSLHEVTSG